MTWGWLQRHEVAGNSLGGWWKKRSQQWRTTLENNEKAVDSCKWIYHDEDNGEESLVVVAEFTRMPWFGRKSSPNLRRKSSLIELRQWIWDATGGGSR
jgi:hypothetical protein